MKKLDRKFEEFLDWARYEADRSDNTIRVYKESYKDFKKFLKEKKLSLDFSTKTLRQYFFYQREKGLKKTTVLVRRKGLKAFTTYLVTVDKSLSVNPFGDICKPVLDERLPEFFNKTDMRLIAEAVEGYPWPNRFTKYRNQTVVALFLYCGLRRSELLNLLVSDVDLTEGTIRVNLGKGAKDRVLAMHPKLQDNMTKYLKYRGKRRTNKLLVSATRYQQPFSESGLKRLMRLIKRQTGITARLFPHKLRHTFATAMAREGVPLNVLRDMLGHTKLSTTAIYLHTAPEMQVEALEKHPLG